MFTYYLYWLVAPYRAEFEDTGERQAAFDLEVPLPVTKMLAEVSLYVDSLGEPEFFRAKIAGLTTKEVPESLAVDLRSIREHMLTILSMTFREDVAFERVSLIDFQPDGELPRLKLTLRKPSAERFNVELARDMFATSFENRSIWRLFQDGSNSGIPLQYRFLSFFKLLEEEFLDKREWKYASLNVFLQPYAITFRELGFRRNVHKTLIDLRDQCAHVRTGGRLGVSPLNHDSAARVEAVFPYVREMCAQIVNRHSRMRGGEKFLIYIDNDLPGGPAGAASR